jgi:hypothetical protein
MQAAPGEAELRTRRAARAGHRLDSGPPSAARAVPADADATIDPAGRHRQENRHRHLPVNYRTRLEHAASRTDSAGRPAVDF